MAAVLSTCPFTGVGASQPTPGYAMSRVTSSQGPGTSFQPEPDYPCEVEVIRYCSRATPKDLPEESWDIPNKSKQET